jgi:hypothetical protein
MDPNLRHAHHGLASSGVFAGYLSGICLEAPVAHLRDTGHINSFHLVALVKGRAMAKRPEREHAELETTAVARTAFEKIPDSPFPWGRSHIHYDLSGPEPVEVFENHDPCVVHCNGEDYYAARSGLDIEHNKVLVRYALWSEPSFRVCWHRIKAWNDHGRYEESRNWVSAYVMLLMALPWLEPLRGVFRLYARSLFWPGYQLLEPEPKAPTSQEEVAPK